MVTLPVSRPGQIKIMPAPAKPQDWAHLVAAGTVLVGGAMLIAGHKKAGIAVAAAGTALALLDEPAAIEGWWKNLPEYLRNAQQFIEKIEGYVEGASTQGHRIQSILRR